MLKLKDRIYVWWLIKSGELTRISEAEKLNLTEEEVNKLRYLDKNQVGYIDYNIVRRLSSAEDILSLLRYENFGWNTVSSMVDNGYDLQDFVDRIVKKYSRSRIVSDDERPIRINYDWENYVYNMISKKYSIDNIGFLLKNNMLYRKYHDEFDYDIIFKVCGTIGFDVTKEWCNIYSLDFIKYLRKKMEAKKCYELLSFNDNNRFMPPKNMRNFVFFLLIKNLIMMR